MRLCQRFDTTSYHGKQVSRHLAVFVRRYENSGKTVYGGNPLHCNYGTEYRIQKQRKQKRDQYLPVSILFWIYLYDNLSLHFFANLSEIIKL